MVFLVWDEPEPWTMRRGELRIAAEGGDVWAMNALAVDLFSTQDADDLEEARHWLEVAARRGDRRAMNNLAALLTRIDPPRRSESLDWLDKAATAGSDYARRNLTQLGVGAAEAGPDVDAPATGLDVVESESPARTARPDPASSDDQRRIRVNVGITRDAEPASETSMARLARNHDYWLNVELGPRRSGSLPGGGAVPVEHLPSQADIDLELIPDAGLLVVGPRRGSFVLAPPADPTRLGPLAVGVPAAEPPGVPEDLLAQRMFFHLHTVEEGRKLIRCCFYVHGVLVQVEEVDLVVGRSAGSESNHLQTAYRLTRSLGESALATIPAQKLSLYLNDNNEFEHTVVLRAGAGADPICCSGTIESTQVAGMIRQAEAALQTASWGYPATQPNYDTDSHYEPNTAGGDFASVMLFSDDLRDLAKAGRRLWNDIFARLTSTDEAQDALREAMRETGSVQLALRSGSDHLLPLQLCYDWPLDTTSNDLRLCSVSQAYLNAAAPRPELACLTAGCPEYADRTVVCPAGFWGFRHRLSITVNNADAITQGTSPDAGGIRPRLLAGLSKDPRLTTLSHDHIAHLATLFDVSPVDELEELRDGLEHCPDLLYFFCHVRSDGPDTVVAVGSTSDQGPGLDPSWLLDRHVDLKGRRPPVFINACHSAAPSPEKMLPLVDRFFRRGASAVIGTEITTQVSLAVPFAEDLLANWQRGASLSEALLRARRTLLSRRNPLGLSYLVFGIHPEPSTPTP